MTASAVVPRNGDASATPWYALAPDEVSKQLDVDPATGLSAAKVAELLKANGPNALPAEPARPSCSAIPRTVLFAARRSAIWIRSCSERYRRCRGLVSLIFTGA